MSDTKNTDTAIDTTTKTVDAGALDVKVRDALTRDIAAAWMNIITDSMGNDTDRKAQFGTTDAVVVGNQVGKDILTLVEVHQTYGKQFSVPYPVGLGHTVDMSILEALGNANGRRGTKNDARAMVESVRVFYRKID